MKKIFSISLLLFTYSFIFSQVITPFTVKNQITQKGGIVYLANVATHCNINPPAIAGTNACKTGALQNPPSGSYADNDFNAVYVDIDNDATTFMSSSDSLNLPVCSEVSWVGLFWGASRGASTTNFNTIKLKSNNNTYTTVTASNSQTNTIGFDTYHCFANVTNLVQNAGIKARFTVADIKSDVGNSNKFGSWVMVVMYKNDLQNMRQLTCFEGLANISSSAPTVNVPVSGFLTPLSGPVSFETGGYVHDGDRGSTGDQLKFNGGAGFVNISDAVNSNNDIMNSTVSNNGVLTPFRKPNLPNTAGLDADIFAPNNTAKNYIGNAATSFTFQMSTGGETYLPQMITTAIDVYEPDLRASIKVKDVNGGLVMPGDILEYKVKGINIGSDPSINTFITDTIEGNANYIPNSVKILHGPNLGSKTDAAGDDQVEYFPALKMLKVRIGTGANTVSGGTVINSAAGADSTVFSFSVTVTNSCTKLACDNIINARAYIFGTGAVSTNTFSNGSNPGIFDAFGCPIPGITSTPITSTACATTSASATPSFVCANNSFTLNTNSDPEVTYLWTGPSSFTSSLQNPVITSPNASASGIYTINLIASPSCKGTATTNITVNSSPTISTISSPTLICSGNSSTLTASGAASYSWNTGATTASILVSPNVTTIYTVTGTTSGCSNTKTISLTVNTTPTINATGSSTAICSGNSSTLTASGATSYSWNSGATTNTVSVSPNVTTTYTITGTTSGCSDTKTISLTVNTTPTVNTSSSPTLICSGNASTLTASGANSYSWNTGATTSTVSVSPNVTTTYTITGTTSGCSDTKTISLTVNTTPTVNATASSTTICSGNASTLTASGATSYSWNTGANTSTVSVSPNVTTTYTVSGTTSGCSDTKTISLTVNTTPTVSTSSSPTLICSGNASTLNASGAASYSWNTGATTSTVSVSPNVTTTYTVTGTTSGCSDTKTISLTVNTTPTVNATASSTAICSGNASTLTASGATSYSWNTGATTNTVSVSPNVTTTYTVTGTTLGCSDTKTISLTVNTTPTVNATTSYTNICSGNASTLTASGAASYSWNTGATTNTVSVSPNVTTTYTVTGTTSGCSDTKTISLTVNTTPTVNATASSTAICSGNASTLTASGATSYSWNTGATTSTVSVSPNLTTTYTVTGTTSGCSDTKTISLTVNTTPTVNATASSTAICSGNASTLTASGATSYSWNTGATTNTVSVSPNVTTTYTVTGTTLGCSDTKTISLTVNTTPTVNATTSYTNICSGNASTLTASGAASYSWNTGATTNTVSVSPNVTTTYTVTGTTSGCSDTKTISLTVNTTPTVNATASSTNICSGNASTLTASGATSYSWNTGATTSNVSVSPLATTIYTVTGTTSGCSDTKTLSLTVITTPTVSTSSSPTLICSGNASTLTATGATSYSWNTGATTSTVSVSPLTTTIYTVTGTTSGCSDTKTLSLSVNTTPTVNASASSTVICSGANATLTASGATSFNWNTVATTSTVSVSPLASTIYTVTGTTSGCSDTKTLSLFVNTTPTVNASASSTAICSGANAALTASGATSYSWNTGATTSTVSVSPLATTIYTVTGTTSGCSDTKTISLTVNTMPTVSASASPTSVCSGANSTLTASGANNYTWNPGNLSGATITPSISSTTIYTVVGSTAAGCSDTKTLTLALNNCPTAVNDFTNTIENTAVSGNVSTNDINTIGGTYSCGQPTSGTGTLSINPATGQYTYTPAPGYNGTTTATYTLCNGSPIVCSSASITIVVYPTLIANSNSIITTPSVTTSGTLTTNDLGIDPNATFSVSVTQLPSTTGTITIDPSTGQYTFTPNPAFTGSAQTTYTICNTSVNPIVCSNATISISVGNLPIAVNDATNTIINTPVSGFAGSNDNGNNPTLNPVYSNGQPTAGTGTLTMDPATGQYTFTPASGFTGTTVATYTLCNLLSPPCATANITFTIYPALIANNDIVTTTPSVTTSGTLTTNDLGIDPNATYSVSVTQLPSTTGTITIDPSTGQYTFTPNPAFTGSAQTTYTICNTSVNPIVCSNATISISVGNLPIAVNDATNTIINTPVSGFAGSNDNGNNPTLNPVYSNGQPTAGTGTLTMDPATGQYTFTPASGFTGTTVATYTLCNLLSPPCATANITFTIYPALIANNDVVTTTPSVTTSGTLTTNDLGIDPNATFSVSVTQLPSTTGTITIDPSTGQYTFTPNPAFTGSAQTTYTICNTSVNPIVCSNATISISVGNLPIAVNDATNTIINTPVSGFAGSNDNGNNPTLNPVYSNGQPTAGTGTLTMDPATGQYTFTPASGFTGTTVATYTLCNLLSPPCATANITFTIYPALIANNDIVTTTPSVTTSGTLTTNDLGIDPNATYSVSVTQLPSTTGTITIDPSTGQYTFTPNPAFTGSAQTTYTICNTSVNPIVCSNATISISVGNLPIAVNDATNTIINTPVSGFAGSNDNGNNPSLNPVYSNGQPTAGTGTLTMDPATGQYTFTPATGFTGTTVATYTLCNLLSPPCATANITFTIYPALIANNDVVTTTPSVTTSGTLTTNDLGIDPNATYSVSVTQLPSTTGTITIDPSTGQYTFVPNPAFIGSAQTTYTICNTSVNPIVCSNATISIIVSGTPVIGSAKSVSTPIYNADNSISLTYKIVVKNHGNISINNVSVADDLSNTFPSPATFTVVSAPILNSSAGTQLTLDANFTGSGSNTLITIPSTSSLSVGRTDTVLFTVKIKLNGSVGPFNNSALVSGNNGTLTTIDVSTNGNNPDPSGNGNPGSSNVPTTFTPSIVKIGLAKAASTPVKENDGSYSITYTLTVKNFGNDTLKNVQVSDTLSNTFKSPATFIVSSAPLASGTLLGNINFNGTSDYNLLIASSSKIDPGVTEKIVFKVNVQPNKVTKFSNIAFAKGTGKYGNMANDVSTSGTNPDLNGNNDPSDIGESDSTKTEIPDDEFFVPNGFTPDGDGKNDFFVIKGLEKYPDNTLYIYNRWGYSVYTKNNYDNSWQGYPNVSGPKFGSDKLPQGTYYFILEFNNSDMKPIKGFVVLDY